MSSLRCLGKAETKVNSSQQNTSISITIEQLYFKKVKKVVISWGVGIVVHGNYSTVSIIWNMDAYKLFGVPG